MGKFHDLLEHLGDSHVVAKVRVELLLSELVLDISDTPDEHLRELLVSWLADR